MPNTFAYIALIVWPLVSMALFKKYTPLKASFLTVLLGYLLLPVKVNIDFPLVPPLDKASIPCASALLGCLILKKTPINFIPKEGVERWVILALMVIPVITVVLNGEPVFNGDMWIGGLTSRDAISALVAQFLWVLPFILGYQLVNTVDDQVLLLKLIVFAGLIYAVPFLYEVRMSPQLHTNVYGFFPHSFAQQKRFGGVRPVVFLGHGLLVAMYIAVVLGAAALMLRAKVKYIQIPPVLLFGFILVLLLLSRTVGAFIYGVFLLLSFRFLPFSLIKLGARVIMVLLISYPMLSILDLFPHEWLLGFFAGFSPDRAQSLGFRFYNEGILLEHAQDKLLFGWGGSGRNRLADVVTDGYWIIQLSMYGIVNFLGIFGLASLSIWRGTSAGVLSRFNAQDKKIMIGLALITSIIMLDQIPNASLAPWMWFFIGGFLKLTRINPKQLAKSTVVE